MIETFNLANRLLAGSQGKSLAWIGNKGNLKALWTQLQADDPLPLEYGDLLILRASGTGKRRIIRRCFGP